MMDPMVEALLKRGLPHRPQTQQMPKMQMPGLQNAIALALQRPSALEDPMNRNLLTQPQRASMR